MKKTNFLGSNLVAAVALSLCFSAGMVDASGSFGGASKSVDSKKEAQYHKGKSVLRKQLLCDGCPLDGQKVSGSTAPKILDQVNAGDFSGVLKAEDQKALSVYLSRRYRIK